MRRLLPHRSVLLLVLLASAASARERDTVTVRTLLLSDAPDDTTHRLYVKGQVVTVLRFEQPVDPARTKLLGWEGRLEPVGVVDKKVLLEPLHDLAADEGIPLLVTLASGKEISFLVRPAGSGEEGASADQQINVFEDRERYGAMYSTLNDALRENKALKQENERFRKEETSEDHALAALLASGAVAQTPFTIADYFSGKDEDSEASGMVYQGKGKVGVVLRLKNLAGRQRWSMKYARLTTLSSGSERAFAFRATSSSIAPGDSGVLAFVTDKRAFMDDGVPTSLFLEIYRHDGLRQAVVQLDPSLVRE